MTMCEFLWRTTLLYHKIVKFFHNCVKCCPMTLPLACSQVSLTSGWSIPICTPGWGKDWTLRVKCLSQEHNTITQATTWTQITQSLKFYNNSQGSTTKIRVGCMNQSKYYTRLKIKNSTWIMSAKFPGLSSQLPGTARFSWSRGWMGCHKSMQFNI